MLQSQSMWFRYLGSGLTLQGDERSEYRPVLRLDRCRLSPFRGHYIAPMTRHDDRADIDSGLVCEN